MVRSPSSDGIRPLPVSLVIFLWRPAGNAAIIRAGLGLSFAPRLPPADLGAGPVVGQDGTGGVVGQHIGLVDVDRSSPVAGRVDHPDALSFFLRYPIRRAARC